MLLSENMGVWLLVNLNLMANDGSHSLPTLRFSSWHWVSKKVVYIERLSWSSQELGNLSSRGRRVSTALAVRQREILHFWVLVGKGPWLLRTMVSKPASAFCFSQLAGFQYNCCGLCTLPNVWAHFEEYHLYVAITESSFSTDNTISFSPPFLF